MSFTTLGYVLFLTVTAVLCYVLKPRARNFLLLAASFVFYGLFGLQYLPFLIAATLLTYFAGRLMANAAPDRRKLWLVSALCVNLGMLFAFKYLPFLATLGQKAFDALGISVALTDPGWILPLGISFYVFQTTGYLIDVYRGTLAPEKNFIDFALFASFFPGLIAGPIQRAGEMLPQYKAKNRFSYENIKSGSLQFVWGAFKKMVIADRLSVLVGTAYAAPANFSGFQLIVAVLCFSVQIYCDVSAYSDMAIGSAKIMGFNLPKNFNNPYFAASIQGFWRRWHISLSSWFRDYLFLPLSGSRKRKLRSWLSIVVVFLIFGLWHGAALTLIVWGFLHGLFLVLGKLLEPLRDRIRTGLHIKKDNGVLRVFRVLFTFCLITAAWVFFRAESLANALLILRKVITQPLAYAPVTAMGLSAPQLWVLLFFTVLLFVADWAQKKYALADRINRSYLPRVAVFFVLLASIMIFGHYGAGFAPIDFIYFRF